MPVLRYFVVAGAGLLALLFVVNAWLPAPVITERDANGLDKTTIRINGDKPVAERVTIDTSVPTIVPPVAALSVAPGVSQADSQGESPRDALARMDDAAVIVSEATPHAAAQPAPLKKIAARKPPKKRPIVVARPAGLFDLW